MKLHLIGLVLAMAGTSLADPTPNVPLLPSAPVYFPPVGAVHQRANANGKALAGVRINLEYADGLKLNCIWSELGGCAAYVQGTFQGLGTGAGFARKGEFDLINNRAGIDVKSVTILGVSPNPVALLKWEETGFYKGKPYVPLLGRLAIDTGDGVGTRGSGKGGPITGGGILGFELVGQLSPDLWSGVKFTVAEGAALNGQQAFQFAFDVDEVTPVPEPATFVMVGLGLAGAALVKRRRKKKTGDCA